MALVNFKVPPESLTAFGIRFTRDKEHQVIQALYDIRREWQVVIVRQQDTFSQGFWPPWKEAGHDAFTIRNGKWKRIRWKSYAERRRAEELNPPPGVKYFTLLKRTGAMMEGYVNGIYVDDNKFSVRVRWPSGAGGKRSIATRARVHQGVVRQPKGSQGPRPFNLEEFNQIARTIITTAVQSDPKTGRYKGFNR